MKTLEIPAIKPVAPIRVTEPEVYTLDNGIAVYGFNGTPNEILKLDLIFDAGRWAESAPLTASATAGLIKSGNPDETAFELEAAIDFLGSTIKASAGYNSFTLSLFCMTRHLESCLRIFSRILRQSTFPEEEIALNKANSLSRFKVNMMKNDYVADMLFKEALFGKEHPYGYRTTADRISAVSRDDLLVYYRGQLRADNCLVGMAGRFSRADIDLVNKYLGQRGAWAGKGPAGEADGFTAIPSAEREIVKELKDSVQAAVYIGKTSISRKDPDYHSLSLLNLVYGGYFGSRLMKNIREEKGLTYGIYSYFQQYRHASAFIISTDTALEYYEQCLHEIYAEMDRLRQQPVDRKELGKARNYMLGRMLDQVDGPFKSASTFLGLKSHNIPLSYVKETEQAILEQEPEDLLAMARKYLDREEMYQIVVR
jgi:predicted Zn-dependent peptidase